MCEKWFIKIVAVLTIINSIALLLFVFCIEKDNNYLFTKDDVVDVLGIVVSCISIVITAYFVVLAIDGYGKVNKIKEIEDTVVSKEKNIIEKEKNIIEKEKNINAMVEKAKESVHYIGYDCKRAIEYLLLLIDYIQKFEYEVKLPPNDSIIGKIMKIGKAKDKDKESDRWSKIRKELMRERYRLGLDASLLKEDDRIESIRYLSTFGDISDIEELEKICNSDTEPNKIKDISVIVLSELKGKYNNDHTKSASL